MRVRFRPCRQFAAGYQAEQRHRDECELALGVGLGVAFFFARLHETNVDMHVLQRRRGLGSDNKHESTA